MTAGSDLPDVIRAVSDFTWADSNVIYYVRQDDECGRVSSTGIASGASHRAINSFEEPDPGFAVSVYRTRTGRYVGITTVSSDMSETYLIDATHPEQAAVLVAARAPDLRYDVDDWGRSSRDPHE